MSNNKPENLSLASFAGELPSVGAVLGTVSEQRIVKDHFINFQYKVKQYVLYKFNNPIDVIIVIRDIKEPYSQIDMENPINLSK